MGGTRWERIQSLFAAAAELPDGERAAFLDRECGDDSELRREIENLLAHDGTAPSIRREIAEAAASVLPTPVFEGRRIGAYRIEQEIGHGGMGTVLLARRDDREFEQRVAIKLMRGTVHRPEAVLRFRNERQILATLDHPNIARLLDGGTIGEGEPYVVMEYVEGRPIDAYCEERQLGVRDRLALFRQVSAAVHFAHGKLVVHRDIKPGNILVTDDGVPKLLDFGIAKLLDPDGTGAPLETTTAQRIMTPHYASPEQVRGDPVTTASDVYSLGVLLYELLTGRRPYRLSTGASGELDQAILSQTPDAPSTALSGPDARKLRRLLAGDLDNIVLMALRKEPERRYSSADQLSADIGRYLDGLPVTARPANLTYRASKFVSRHRVALAASVLVVLSIVTLATFYTLRLRRERDQATVERNKARRVADLMIDLFEVADPGEARGNAITAREILDRAVETVPGELGDQPEIQATMLNTMGRVYLNLGLYKDSRPLLERALAARRALYGDDHLEVADTLHVLGGLDLVQMDHASANEHIAEAVAIRGRLLGPMHPDYAEALRDQGSVHAQTKALDDERELLERALAIQEQVLDPNDPNIAETLTYLGVVHLREDGTEAGLATWQRAAAIHEAALGPDHPDLILSLNNVCYALRILNRYDEALPLAERVLALCEKHLGPDHLTTAYNRVGLSNVLFETNQVERAAAMRLAALTAVERALGPDHRRVGLIALYAARSLTALDRFDEARALLDRALGTYPPASSGAADVRFWRARIALLEGRVDELIREARTGAEIQLAIDDAYEYDRRCAFVMQALAAAHAGDRATTLERVERAHKTAEWNEDSADGEQLLLIAVALALVGETDRSVEEARNGLGRCEKNLGPHHAQTAQLVEHYVNVLERRGARQHAERFRQALP